MNDINEQHYPSFELCKKLNFLYEWWIPSSCLWIENSDCTQHYMAKEKFYANDNDYCCPWVMALLDLIPPSIDDYEFKMWYTWAWYSKEEWKYLFVSNETTLPNALAETVIWLTEKKFIPNRLYETITI